MTNYVVTTRNKAGALEERAYTAETRADLFKQLAADGITAVRIAEGVPGKKPRKASSGGGTKIPFKTVGLVAASLVALIAAVVIIMSLTRDEEIEVTKTITGNQTESIGSDKEVVDPTKESESYRLQQGTNQPNSTVKKTEEKNVSPAVTNTATYSVEAAIEESIKRGRRPLFKHQSDVWLSQFIEPGVCVPPIPMTITQDEFLKSVKEPITFEEIDTPEERAIKEAVVAMREEAVAFIKEGGTYGEYMKELARRQKDESDIMTEARSLMIEDFRERGDFEQSLELLRTVNKELESKGLRKMGIPAPIKIRMVRQGIKIPEV